MPAEVDRSVALFDGRARALPGERRRRGRCRGAGHGRRRNPGARGVDDRRERPAESRRNGDEAIERAQPCVTEIDPTLERGATVSRAITRRHFFEQTSFGIGGLALASLMDDGRPCQSSCAGGRRVRRARADFRGKGQERHLSLHGRRAVAARSVRSEAEAARSTMARRFRRRSIKGERFAFIKGTPKLLASPFTFAQARTVRRRDLRAAARSGEGRRRDRDRAVDAHDAVQPRAGADLHEHRPPGHRPAEHGVLADLRSGQRERGPARLRRPALGREQPGRREVMLGQRISADGVSGRRVPIATATRCCSSRIPTASTPRCAARIARPPSTI